MSLTPETEAHRSSRRAVEVTGWVKFLNGMVWAACSLAPVGVCLFMELGKVTWIYYCPPVVGFVLGFFLAKPMSVELERSFWRGVVENAILMPLLQCCIFVPLFAISFGSLVAIVPAFLWCLFLPLTNPILLSAIVGATCIGIYWSVRLLTRRR